MDTNQYIDEIEQKVLNVIKEKLVAGEMTEERAREIARYILDSLSPKMNINSIYKVAQNFDDHFPELIPVTLEASRKYDEQVRDIVGQQVGKLLKENKIEEADNLVKQALDRKVEV